MMSDKSKVKSLGEMSAFERWELPEIGEGKPDTPAQKVEQKFKPPTAEELEQIHKQAYQDGYDEGYKAGFNNGHKDGLRSGEQQGIELGKQTGLQQGLEDAKPLIDQQKARLSELINALEHPISEQIEMLQQSLLNVTIALSRAVIFRSLEQDKSIIQEALNAVLSDIERMSVPDSLLVNPDDFGVVQEVLERIGSSIKLKGDASVLPGGLKLESASQIVDYTVEKRFQKSVQAILNQRYDVRQSETASEQSLDDLSSLHAEVLSQPEIQNATQPLAQGMDSPSSGSQTESHQINTRKSEHSDEDNGGESI